MARRFKFIETDLPKYSESWQKAMELYESTTGIHPLDNSFYSQLRDQHPDNLKLAQTMIQFNRGLKSAKDRSVYYKIPAMILHIDYIADAVHRALPESVSLEASAQTKITLFTAMGLLLQTTRGSKRAYGATEKLILKIEPLYARLERGFDSTRLADDDGDTRDLSIYEPTFTELLQFFGLLTKHLNENLGTTLKRLKEASFGNRISAEELANKIGGEKDMQSSLQRIARSIQQLKLLCDDDEFWRGFWRDVDHI